MQQKKHTLLEVKNLTVTFKSGHLPPLEANAVDEVSFTLSEGKTLCLVGESGCGKSMTALALMGLVPMPGKISAGEIYFEGKNLLTLGEAGLREIRGNKIGMIFQEPMTALNPVLTIGDQIEEVLFAHKKITKQEAKKRCLELLAKVGIPAAAERRNSYPHELSGGMRQRIVIAMAIACNPKLIIADEPTTALDATIQRQILDLIEMLSKEFGTATLLITHDLGVVRETADKVLVMYAGIVVEKGSPEEIFTQPMHPYTKGLIASSPTMPKALAGAPHDCARELGRSVPQTKMRLPTIAGTVPNLWDEICGCPFNSRCPHAFAPCFQKLPAFYNAKDTAPHNESHQRARCWLYEEQNKGKA